MCNPLLDISAVVPPEVLEKYGVKAGDAILAEEKHTPVYAEIVEKFEVQYIAGGAGQNSVRVAQVCLRPLLKTSPQQHAQGILIDTPILQLSIE